MGVDIKLCRLQQEHLWWLYLKDYYGHNYLQVTLGLVLSHVSHNLCFQAGCFVSPLAGFCLSERKEELSRRKRLLRRKGLSTRFSLPLNLCLESKVCSGRVPFFFLLKVRGVRGVVGMEWHLTLVAFANKCNTILCFNLIFGVVILFDSDIITKRFLDQVFFFLKTDLMKLKYFFGIYQLWQTWTIFWKGTYGKAMESEQYTVIMCVWSVLCLHIQMERCSPPCSLRSWSVCTYYGNEWMKKSWGYLWIKWGSRTVGQVKLWKRPARGKLWVKLSIQRTWERSRTIVASPDLPHLQHYDCSMCKSVNHQPSSYVLEEACAFREVWVIHGACEKGVEHSTQNRAVMPSSMFPHPRLPPAGAEGVGGLSQGRGAGGALRRNAAEWLVPEAPGKRVSPHPSVCPLFLRSRVSGLSLLR